VVAVTIMRQTNGGGGSPARGSQPVGPLGLTVAEFLLLRFLALGASQEEICEVLHTTEAGYAERTEAVRRKLAAESIEQALEIAKRAGVV